MYNRINLGSMAILHMMNLRLLSPPFKKKKKHNLIGNGLNSKSPTKILEDKQTYTLFKNLNNKKV